VIFLSSKKEKTKDERIKAEERRLKRSYKNLSKDTLMVVDGLIKRASFMLVTLEDMEEDLDTDGFVELFSQSLNQEPYERERPVARLYNTMNKNYQSIVKSLADHLPKEVPKQQVNPLEMFSSRRDE
jgi:hypothetical protein